MEYARSKKLKIFLTLHHFTIPLWFEIKGGFSNFNSPKYFEKYIIKCIQEFKDYADIFGTINEPEVLSALGYIYGEWAPFKKNKLLSLIVLLNLHRCHKKAYTIIKEITNKKVGIVTNITCYQPKDASKFLDCYIADLIQDFFIRLSLFPIRNHIDFIGLNFYQTQLVSGFNVSNNYEPKDEMGWYINFDSIKIILNKLKVFNLDVYITENGLADSKDELREWYLKYMLISLAESIEKDKVKVKGYIHWTLTDNFEWQYGYSKKFGLVEIDRKKDLKRIKRKSFAYYQIICKTKQVIE